MVARPRQLEAVGRVPRRGRRLGRAIETFARSGSLSRASSRAAPNAAAARSPPARPTSVAKFRSMKPVSNVPARNSSARQSAASSARLVCGPGRDGVVERRGKLVERRLAGRRMRDHLGDHRIVVRRDRAALLDAGIDTHAVGEIAAPAACRSTAETRAPDPRHRCAPRRRGPASGTASCVSGSFSPAAIRNCHSTRSSPVIASVTGCSTCSRVFISMNQTPSGRSPFEPSAMNSTVPAPT